MPTLFIRLQSPVFRDEDGLDLSCDWLILENDGGVRASGVTDYRGLTELIDPSADWLQNPHNLVIVVPAENVLAVNAEVPGRSVGQIRRALPFVVEEFVAADIENMHLAHGPIKRGAKVRVNLVDRSYLKEWMACFDELGLRPGYMVSDAELLPTTAQSATLLLESDTVLIRTDDQAASIDRDNLSMALGSLAVDRLEVVNGELDPETASQLDPGIELVQGEGESGEAPLVYLAHRWRDLPDAVNLLQGEYTAAKPASENSFRWRSVAMLAGIWLLVGLIGMVVQGIWAGLRADNLQAQSEALYRDIFPGETRINNVRRQMGQKLGQRSEEGGTGFSTYLGHLAQGIDKSVSIWSVTYSETRDELAADLQLRNYDDLERLKQRMGQLGVEVEITSAEQQDSGVRARVRLQGSGDSA